ncbi:MAG: pyruvate:ferredoxin (flavodoxin) oxidoreductase [Acidimicrobiales bacterium]|nr:MAG: pyruvate:ferredoxin (flavodoxin) oxidoreductase [Acidimicrobiales bacterium]
MAADHREHITVDGNEAAARVAHKVSEVIAIYPITPASPMGELADAWSQGGVKNIWGVVPEVVEMQSEGGAAGAVHGSLQAGALTTTFTASQGLLLMIPNLYKMAGELLPLVIHVAARSVATHALSIFGDHSDVMAARQTGMALLASGSVQEAQDMALISHAATLRTRIPFLHFFDGFRTSHEVSKIEAVSEDMIKAMIDDDLVVENRLRGLDPDRPVLRGTAQNPDVFFQAREAANPFHAAVPDVVREEMQRFAELTGRRYLPFDYHGHPEAEDVAIIMGSGAGAVVEAVDQINADGGKAGVVIVRLYRPFDTAAFAEVLPSTTRRIAVLDRTKEPGSPGEPLYLDVVAALDRTADSESRPLVIGGRYGLSSKEFTPPMAVAVFDELHADAPRREITVGIIDDVGHTSVVAEAEWHEPATVKRAVFYGLGSDGTVGANKNTVKIVGASTDLHAQGYFVYDSKKSGSTTVSHLRFSPDPIRSAYLISEADFVGVHHFGAFERGGVLDVAGPGATLLINSPYDADGTWENLPGETQQMIIDKGLDVWIVDGGAVARESGLGRRINTVLQTCHFHLSQLLPPEEAVTAIKDAIKKTYGKRGAVVLERNIAAVDAAVGALVRLDVPAAAKGTKQIRPPVPEHAPDFVQRVTGRIMAGEGDLLPVSALPVDGTFPTGTTKWEKRSIAPEIPIWDAEICIDCARCALVCPHAAIRLKVVPEAELAGAPDSFVHKSWKDPNDATARAIIQVAPDDCTGCGVCVAICPAKSKEVVKHKAINMTPIDTFLERERQNFEYFLTLPEKSRTSIKLETVKGSQLAQPLFEFSGACSGCGETPYLKLLTQLMGDRMVVANATGCSSIYGGNLPTTPWATDDAGRGPAWANSLFEDNAEFGLGMRLALDSQAAAAKGLVEALASDIGPLAAALLEEPEIHDEEWIAAQRGRVDDLRSWLLEHPSPEADHLASMAQHLVDRSVWLIGGDGWAYDIGFGGVDHVLASGRDVNILVLDTEVYSNTGGQTSKSTPRAAIAKFSAGGKATAKKDLGMIAMAYGDVYVAHIAMGANMTQTVKALTEAAAHPGPSLVIAYSPCIAHGIDMTDMMGHQKMAAASGYWPLYRFDPLRESEGDHALHLDSRKPTIPFKEFASTEARFSMLARANPEAADELMMMAQQDIDDRWHLYEQMVEVEHTARFGIVDEEDDV